MLGQRTNTALDPALGVPRAILIEPDGTQRFLPTLGGPTARGLAINSRGDIVGVSDTADGRAEGFVWEYATGAITSIGTLDGLSSRATLWLGNDIVLGEASAPGDTTHAVAWTPEAGLVDLNTLLTDPDLTLHRPRGLLADGRVLLDASDTQGQPVQMAARITLVEALPGDVTRDGRVDQADLLEAIRLIQAGDASGDLDGNGQTNAQDLVVVSRQMGRVAKPIEEVSPAGAP